MSFDWAAVWAAADECRAAHEDDEIPEHYLLYLPVGTSDEIVGMAEQLLDIDVVRTSVTRPTFGSPPPYVPFNPSGRTPSQTKAATAMGAFLEAMTGIEATDEDQMRILQILETQSIITHAWSKFTDITES